jgi:hypothetical protein
LRLEVLYNCTFGLFKCICPCSAFGDEGSWLKSGL